MKIQNKFIARGITKDRKFVYGYPFFDEQNNIWKILTYQEPHEIIGDYITILVVQEPDKFLGEYDDFGNPIFALDIVEYESKTYFNDSKRKNYDVVTPDILQLIRDRGDPSATFGYKIDKIKMVGNVYCTPELIPEDEREEYEEYIIK